MGNAKYNQKPCDHDPEEVEVPETPAFDLTCSVNEVLCSSMPLRDGNENTNFHDVFLVLRTFRQSDECGGVTRKCMVQTMTFEQVAAQILNKVEQFDTDSDGIPDFFDGAQDTDGDTLADYLDTDADSDGISDSLEGTTDTDSDGTPDFRDLDSDNDKIPDSLEGVGDTDSDGTPDFRDLDSDNDGIEDFSEGTRDSDSDGTFDFRETDADSDGTLDTL